MMRAIYVLSPILVKVGQCILGMHKGNELTSVSFQTRRSLENLRNDKPYLEEEKKAASENNKKKMYTNK